MAREKASYTTIDEYINLFEPEVQEKLQQVRKVIHENAPQATEKISWDMPTFYLNGNLIHFAAFKNHIGIYPGADGVVFLQDKITEYKSTKGAVQFPLNKPIPFNLIKEVVEFRVQQNLETK